MLYATSDAHLEELIGEAETYKLETKKFALVLKSWQGWMGPEEIGEIVVEVDEEMELLDEDEEFEVLEKKSLELEIRNLLSQFAKVQEELDSDENGLGRAFDTVSSTMSRLDAKVQKLGGDATEN